MAATIEAQPRDAEYFGPQHDSRHFISRDDREGEYYGDEQQADAESAIDFGRLRRAEIESTRAFQGFRDGRRETIRACAGSSHGSSADVSEPRLLPELRNVFLTYKENLLPNAPKCSLSTSIIKLMPSAFQNELATNAYLKRTDFEGLADEWVGDSLFGIGIAKVSLQKRMVATQYGMLPGYQPVADRISFDDFTFDRTAKSFRECKFYGHYYRADLKWARNNPDFDPTVRAQLGPIDNYETTREGGERAQYVGDTTRSVQETVSDETMLLELYVPEHSLIVTYDGNTESETPLEVRPWDGVPDGPYTFLFFDHLPDNPMPLSFIESLYLLDEVQQTIFDKTSAQALRQKSNIAFRGSAAADGTRVIEAPDGEYVRVDHPDALRPISTGGFDPANLAFFMQTRQLFNRAAGNPDALSGLSPQSDTATQDKLLYGAVTAHVRKMQQKVTAFLTKVVDDIARYLYTDPIAVYPVDVPLPGNLGAVKETITPEQRRDAWDNFQIQCDVYSAPPQSPNERAQKTMMFLQTAVFPLLPILQQQGMMLDAQGLVRMLARDLGLSEELGSIIIFATPNDPQKQDAARAEQSTKPPVSTRTYKRINETPQKVGGGGDEQQQMRDLLQMSARNKGGA